MKFTEPRLFANSDVAARKIVKLANAVEAMQDGHIHIGKINAPFRRLRKKYYCHLPHGCQILPLAGDQEHAPLGNST